MTRRLVDLSMPVRNDMQTFPRLVRPSLEMWETWEEFADRIGASEHGATWLTATYRVELSDHVGTHLDARRHVSDTAPGPEGIPIEYCYGDGVLLDFRTKPFGDAITVDDLKLELGRIDYDLNPFDIVLIHTGAGAYQNEPRYLTDHCGMSAEATLWLIERGVKMMGIDAITFDPPVWAMFERRKFWEAHLVMREHEYYHLENLTNLEKIGRSSAFTLAVFPVLWSGTTAAPVRAVAIVDDDG
jgi:kynurenine formamidase